MVNGIILLYVAVFQIVPRPDLVEMHDVAATDPLLLIHLKVRTSFVICVFG